MKRIYFLVPDIATTHKIVNELRSEGMEDEHIHILAKRDTPLEDMREAGVTIKTDFIPAVERGVALGGTTGLLAGLNRFAVCRFCHCRRPNFGYHYGRSNYRLTHGRIGGNEFRQFKIKEVRTGH